MTDEPRTSPTITLFAFIIVIIMIAGGAFLLLSSQPQPVSITINPPVPTATPAPTATREPILVYITGAVAEPEQTLSMPYYSRVQEVIDAAGGLTADADVERVNLAGIVRDGDQIHVPAIVENDTGEVTLATPSGGNIIYINTATQEELETLPGIGPATAADIIAYRESSGNFTSLDDLDNVSGIGASTLEALEDLVSFD